MGPQHCYKAFGDSAGASENGSKSEEWRDRATALLEWLQSRLHASQALLLHLWKIRPEFLDAW